MRCAWSRSPAVAAASVVLAVVFAVVSSSAADDGDRYFEKSSSDSERIQGMYNELARARAERNIARGALRSADRALHACSQSSSLARQVHVDVGTDGAAKAQDLQDCFDEEQIPFASQARRVDSEDGAVRVLASSIATLRETADALEDQLIDMIGEQKYAEVIGADGYGDTLARMELAGAQVSAADASDRPSYRRADKSASWKLGEHNNLRRESQKHLENNPSLQPLRGAIAPDLSWEIGEEESNSEPMSFIGLLLVASVAAGLEFMRLTVCEKAMERAYSQEDMESALRGAQTFEFGLALLRAISLAYLGGFCGKAPLFVYLGDVESLLKSEELWWLSLIVVVDAGMRSVTLAMRLPRSVASVRLQWRSMLRDASFLLMAVTSIVSRSPEAWLPGAHLIVLRIGAQLVAASLAFVSPTMTSLTAISDGVVLVSSWIVVTLAIIHGIGPLSVLGLLPCVVAAIDFWSDHLAPCCTSPRKS